MASSASNHLPFEITPTLKSADPSQIKGKALANELSIIPPADQSPRYPLPVGIVRRNRGKLLDISNTVPKKKTRKKRVKTEKTEKTKKQKPSNIASIVSESLKRQKKKQMMLDKKTKELKESKEKRKQEIKEQNSLIRKKNLSKFSRKASPEKKRANSVEKIRPNLKVCHNRSNSNDIQLIKQKEFKIKSKIKKNLRRHTQKVDDLLLIYEPAPAVEDTDLLHIKEEDDLTQESPQPTFYNPENALVTLLQTVFRAFCAREVVESLFEDFIVQNLSNLRDIYPPIPAKSFPESDIIIEEHPVSAETPIFTEENNDQSVQDLFRAEVPPQPSELLSDYPENIPQVQSENIEEFIDDDIRSEPSITEEADFNLRKQQILRIFSDSSDEQYEEVSFASDDLVEAIFDGLLCHVSEKILNEEIGAQFISLDLEQVIKNQKENSDSERYIKTDPDSVVTYVNEIFKACRGMLEEVNASLRKPLYRSPLSILAKAEDSEIGTPVTPEYIIFPPVISVDIYLNIENIKEESSSRKSLSPGSLQITVEAEHIHNKLIFDTVNEALQKHRPYGVKGTPMPWLQNKELLGKSSLTLAEVKNLVLAEIEQWSYMQVGKIATSDFNLTNGEIDEEFLHHIREERLSAMLAEELYLCDGVWVDYEFEETQVGLDVSDMVLEDLVIDVLSFLN